MCIKVNRLVECHSSALWLEPCVHASVYKDLGLTKHSDHTLNSPTHATQYFSCICPVKCFLSGHCTRMTGNVLCQTIVPSYTFNPTHTYLCTETRLSERRRCDTRVCGWVEGEDAAIIREGQTVTLINGGNIRITKVTRWGGVVSLLTISFVASFVGCAFESRCIYVHVNSF